MNDRTMENIKKEKKHSLPKGWEIKRLEDAVEFQRGLTYSKKDEVDFSDNIVLRSNNVDLIKNELDFTELKYINPAIDVQESKKVKKGSLLICTANGSKSHLGKVALIDDDYNYAFGGFMGQVTPKEKLDSKFLFYLMTSDNYKKFINELSDGANINNLKFSDLGQFEIPLPPLPEQQRIVAILDETFSAIDKAKANAEQNLKNAKELFESYLQGVFEKKGDGWEERTIGEIGSPKMCKRIFKEQTSTIGDIPFYKIGTFGKEPDAYISKEIYEEYRAKYSFPKKGDILISASGTIGRRVRYNGEPAYFQDSNIVWIDNDESQVSNDLLYEFYGVCKWGSTEGATISRLYNDNLKSIKINFPKSKKEQQTIVRQLDTLRIETQKLESIYQKKILLLEELKKSILQKAFSGELN
jgi:type I restriction enzyme S subunit